MRRAVSGLDFAAIAVVLMVGACTFYAFTAGSAKPGTATYTTTLVETSLGRTSTVLVPTTSTDTVTSLATSTATLTSTVVQTSTGTTTETSTRTETSTTTETSPTTTTETVTVTSIGTVTVTTSTTYSLGTYGFAIGYTVTKAQICQPDPLVKCTWSGTASWPTSACNYTSACQNFSLGPLANGKSYPITMGDCGVSIGWGLSMITPANESQLSVTITNPQGAVVYQTSTSSTTTSLIGSYAPC